MKILRGASITGIGMSLGMLVNAIVDKNPAAFYAWLAAATAFGGLLLQDIKREETTRFWRPTGFSMQPAELRPAFSWTCDRCGRDNFESIAIREMPVDELRAVCELVPDEAQTGALMKVPLVVCCRHCGVVFKTQFAIPSEEPS